MKYNEREYAIAVAGAMGFRGLTAIAWIKSNLDIIIPESTYWRLLGTIEATPFTELESIAINKIVLHNQRLNYFYYLRTSGQKLLDKEDKPALKMRMILQLAELEKYIAQLETMSRKYFLRAIKEGVIIKEEIPLPLPGDNINDQIL